MTAITAVVGNYNGENVLPDCFASLRGQTLKPTRILVVDGASADTSAAVASDAGAMVLRRENRGLGYLYNEGVGQADTEYVFLGNNDIALEPTCLEVLVAALESAPEAFAADARQLDWTGERTIHARTTLTRGRMFREYLPGLHLDPNVPAEHVTSTVCANGAAMLVRRSVFRELGGFDETFFMEWEDLDLCWRGWLRGRPTLYVPQAIVRHRVGAVTTSADRPRRSASSHHNLMRFALKCLPAPAAARVIAGEFLRLPAHPRAVLTGLLSVARELPEIFRERGRIGPTPELLREILRGQT